MYRAMWILTFAGTLSGVLVKCSLGAPASAPSKEWSSAAPREEIRPRFSFEPAGGHAGASRLMIESDGRPGLEGYWTRSFPLQGGPYYEFRAFRRVADVSNP